MKKILSFLLLFALLLLSLSACADSDDGHGKPTVLGEESSELISALSEHLQSLLISYSMTEVILANQIDKIKNGAQPLLVTFDPSEFYYVCGYYKGTNEDETSFYRNASDYVWLRYEKAEDIRETYRGRTCIAAFQLNPASTVTDIRSDSARVPVFEHFTMIRPEFSGGYNTATFDVFDDTFIYLKPKEKGAVYTASTHFDSWNTWVYVTLEGERFIPVSLYQIRSTGERDDYDLEKEFGKYYDALMSIMITDRYSAPFGIDMMYYGLFSIEDFAEILK